MNYKSFDLYLKELNNTEKEWRLNTLRKIKFLIEKGDAPKIKDLGAINNHIHTKYSFSPYSPTNAIWKAYEAGLVTAGIMDHDSISGAEEFIKAGEILGIETTIGVECRANFSKTLLRGKRINSPDQKSIAYVTIHGIPHQMINTVKKYFKPFIDERIKRNKLMIDNINNLTEKTKIKIDYEKDVVTISNVNNGGSITERHLLFALALKLVETYGKGEKLIEILQNKFDLNISKKTYCYLMDEKNVYYEYDLLGVLKSELVSKIYIDAMEECPYIEDLILFTKEIGAISAYAYLGDVKASVTGDKKDQTFEDSYLELLFNVIKDLGFNAVTYMPSRNTKEQLNRIKKMCNDNHLFQISGEDINSPRQEFVCEALIREENNNLIDSTWALIGHEKAATEDINQGMFSKKIISEIPELNRRIKMYKELAYRRKSTKL